MPIRILSWNVRGLGRLEKRRMLKDMVMRHWAKVVLIQESKLEVVDSG